MPVDPKKTDAMRLRLVANGGMSAGAALFNNEGSMIVRFLK
jgi:hypothetical protein